MKRFELVVKMVGTLGTELLISFDHINNAPDKQFMFLKVGNRSIALIDKKRQVLKYKFQTADTVFFTLTEKGVV
jgi:hypothetical protein